MTCTHSLPRYLENIEAIATSFGIGSLTPRIRAVSETLSDGGLVDVAILGQFKSGKSTFLNTLFGRDIVPVDVLPTTAVVTRVGFGPADRAVVHLLSGDTVEAAIGSLADYVTESGNPDNRKEVALVEVESPSLAGFQGVRFADTPGLGSLFRHNTQASMDWLPRVGAAIVAVSIDHPVSESDLQLMDELSRHTPEMIVLLTKADLVTPEQADKIVAFTRTQLERHFSRRIPVYPFSTRPSFGAQRDALREFLVRRVVENHEARSAEIIRHKVGALGALCREYLSVALQAATADEAALSELRELLKREKDDFGQIRNEVWLIAGDHKTRVQNAALERFGAQREELAEKLFAGLNAKSTEWTGNLERTSAAYKTWLESTLDVELKELSLQGEDFLAPHLARSQAAIARSVQAFQDRLANAIQKALHTTLVGARFDGEVAQPSKPDVRVGKTFDIPFDMIWFVIPMFVARPLVLRHFRRRIRWEVEKNLSRLGVQWADAFNRAIDGLCAQAVAFIRGEIDVVERLVSQTGDRRDEIIEALAKLEPGFDERENDVQ